MGGRVGGGGGGQGGCERRIEVFGKIYKKRNLGGGEVSGGGVTKRNQGGVEGFAKKSGGGVGRGGQEGGRVGGGGQGGCERNVGGRGCSGVWEM